MMVRSSQFTIKACMAVNKLWHMPVMFITEDNVKLGLWYVVLSIASNKQTNKLSQSFIRDKETFYHRTSHHKPT